MNEALDDRIIVEVFGARIAVEALSHAEENSFSEAWSRCLTKMPGAVDLRLFRPSGAWPLAKEALLQRINSAAIEQARGHLLMFHAAGLQLRGSAGVIAFVAPSGTGKSTLSSKLGRVMNYVSDEVVAVDSSMQVLPFPKPVSLMPAGGLGEKTQYAPDELQLGHRLVKPAALQSIVVLNRSPEHREPRFRRLTLAESLHRLVPEISGLGSLNNPLNRLCEVIRVTGGVHELCYSEADHIGIELLCSLLPLETNMQEPWVHLAQVVKPESGSLTGYVRAPVSDSIMIGHSAFILASGRLVELGELASAIWEIMPDCRSTQGMLESLRKRFGAHPGDTDLMANALRTMELQGLIRSQGSGHLRSDALKDVSDK